MNSIRILTLYGDAVAVPLTIVFDGGNAPHGTPRPHSTPQMEILYSRAGQTADDIIERVAYRMRDYGEVLAVTDDYAERDTVLSLDGLASSCRNFIQDVERALREQARDIVRHNRRERHKFKEIKAAITRKRGVGSGP